MKAFRGIAGVVPFAAVLAGCTGCDKKDATITAPSATASVSEPANASASVAASAPARPDGERPRFRGGLTGSFFHAAKNLDLKPDQRGAIEKLEEGIKPDGTDKARIAPTRTEMKDLHTEIVAQTKAGKIDSAKIEPRLAAIEKSAQAQRDKESDALNGLHEALEPAQRTAVAAELRAHPFGRPDEKTDKAASPPPKEEWTKRRVARMTKELDLDPDQQKKLEAIYAKETPGAGVPDRSEMRQQWDATVDAFGKDTFDAKKIDAFAGAGKKGRAFVERQVKLLAQIVPLLRPEQRDKLGSAIEPGAMRPRLFGRGPMGAEREHLLAPLLFEDEEAMPSIAPSPPPPH